MKEFCLLGKFKELYINDKQTNYILNWLKLHSSLIESTERDTVTNLEGLVSQLISSKLVCSKNIVLLQKKVFVTIIVINKSVQ